MAPRVFILGVSGYIGGQVLENITLKHPEYSIKGLVRTEEQKEKLTLKFPSVEFVIGNLDSNEVFEQSKQADVVLQAADADHLGVISSITRGLAEGGKNGAFIQLSGSASAYDFSNGFGNLTPKVWDDIADFDQISTFDESVWHAKSDQLVLSEQKKLGVRAIILEPCLVYGKSVGLKPHSMAFRWLVDCVTKHGQMFRVGEAKQMVSSVHIRDLSDVIVFFIEKALAPGGGDVEWDGKGIYYVEGEENDFASIVNVLAKAMYEKGLIKTTEVESLSAEEVNKFHPWASILWGANMRIHASRLRGLGWTPKQAGIIDTVAEILD